MKPEEATRVCNFLSALVLRNGDVLWHEATDSHSDLVRHFKLPDDRECRHFAKIEFTPSNRPDRFPDYANVDGYVFKVDEATAPSWFADVRESVVTKCRSIVSGMIIDGEHDLIIGGKWLLAGEAFVREFKAGFVVAMSDSARVDLMSDSARVGSMSDSAKIGAMTDSARVGLMHGSAYIGAMSGLACVDAMYDSTKVFSMCDSACVGSMAVSSSVGSMFGSTRVGSMHGSARVGTMYGLTCVGLMFSSARVGSMRDSACVGSMSDLTSVGSMFASARVISMSDSAKVENDTRL